MPNGEFVTAVFAVNIFLTPFVSWIVFDFVHVIFVGYSFIFWLCVLWWDLYFVSISYLGYNGFFPFVLYRYFIGTLSF